MKRFVVPVVTLALVAAMAVPALADDGILDRLKQLSQQEQTQVTMPAGATTLSDLASALVPDQAEVELDVDLEAGETHLDRLNAFLARMETQAAAQPGDVETLAKLGIAYQMASQHGQARRAFEKALLAAPTAQALYDDLAKSLVAADPGLKVYVNGKQTNFDVQPVLQNGRTLVPIRAVIEQLGGTVGWDAATRTVTVTLGTNTVQITLGSDMAQVNGAPVKMDVAAGVIDGRTLLPLRFVSENLNEQVDYHPGGVAGSAVISIIDK